MALQLSGPISLADIAAEFGDSPPHFLSEFYRNAGKVPDFNTNVPTSGQISFGNLYGGIDALVQEVTAQASVNAQDVFGTTWGDDVPKRLVIPSGVTIGPLTVPAGLAGSLVVENAGEIQGLGGAANGGAGGNAVTALSSFTLINTGAVRGGGGGGGIGGVGGQGSVTSTVTEGPFYNINNPVYLWVYTESNNFGPSYGVTWNGVSAGGGSTAATSHVSGIYTYLRGTTQATLPYGFEDDSGVQYYHTVSRQYQQTTYTAGGAGGAGGVGQGYSQTFAVGSAGSAGGTNAGVGGTGGTGGDWATAGTAGSAGANGNYTSGLAGGAAGAAGLAIEMAAGILTLDNTGTLNGEIEGNLAIPVSAASSVNAQTVFGAEWGAATDKRLVVPANVVIGPLTIPSGLGGTLTVQNEGEIQGLGGGPSGGAGGDAITASSSFTLENTGAVRGGGGGGGLGGTGGQGSFTFNNYTAYRGDGFNNWEIFQSVVVRWDGSIVASGFNASLTTVQVGSLYYERGAFYQQQSQGDGDWSYYYQVRRYTIDTAYSAGGVGGAGGRGRGYGQTLLAGSAGSAGGTNAGAGGTGGTGADWGAVGATGGTGANGNYTSGLAGATGGAAGRAVRMNAGTLTVSTAGTINGAY